MKQLNKSYVDIKEKSPKYAEKVRVAVFETAEGLKNNPEIYAVDKYRKNNDGSIRAFETYLHRVSYQVREKK